MSDKVVYIGDLLSEDILGGAELNDHELCSLLIEDGVDLKKIRSYEVTPSVLKEHSNAKLIISNFALLKENIKKEIISNFKYIIYEHDHKYLRSRDPGLYKDYKAPESEIVNLHFYENATAVLCQSSFHKRIIENNIKIKNIINLSGNLWPDKSLDLLQELAKNNKEDRCSILKSHIPHKNTEKAIFFCKKNNYKYELISSPVYEEFLKMLSKNDKLAFFPGTPETLSRVVVEARMMGVALKVSKNIGALHEPWIKLKGEELVAFMRNKRTEIPKTVMEYINE